MREPKFSVGERVILVSKSRPDLNGQTYNILRVLPHNTPYICPFSGLGGIINISSHGYGYILDDPSLMDDLDSPGEPMGVVWDETALRKIPPTSEDSFRQMMEKLKQGETELA